MKKFGIKLTYKVLQFDDNGNPCGADFASATFENENVTTAWMALAFFLTEKFTWRREVVSVDYYETLERLPLKKDSVALDDAIELKLVDDYGCHKKCGSYWHKCECEFV